MKIKEGLLAVAILSITVFNGCCPDPDIVCVQVNVLEGKIINPSNEELMEGASVTTDQLWIITEFDFETSVCENGGSALLRSPDCDPDYQAHRADIADIEIIALNTFDKLGTDVDLSHFFQMAILDSNCVDDTNSFTNCDNGMVTSEQFITSINQHLAINAESDLNFVFGFNIIEALEEAIVLAFEITFTLENGTELSYTTPQVELTP